MTTLPPTQAQPSDVPAATQSQGFRRRRRWAVAVLIVLAVLGGVAGGLGWLGASESGLRWLCSGLVQLSAGRLQIDGAGGRLFGDWHVQSVRWRDATQDIEVQHLAVAWSPAALAHGQLAFERIDAASLRVVSTAQATPPTLPNSLQLPLAVRVGQLRVGQLRMGASSTGDTLVAEAIVAALDSDGRRHRLERLEARLGLLTLAADATLAGQPPFAVQARATLSGAARGQTFSVDVLGGGALDRLKIDGKALAGVDAGRAAVGAAGEFHGLLTPFAAPALRTLDVNLRGIDPALLVAGAPQALLDVELELAGQPAAGGDVAASGRLRVANRASGGLDRQLLPLLSAQSKISWHGDALAFDDLLLTLAGGGRLAGQGRLAGEQLTLDLLARGVDAHALHGELPSTRLSGPLHADLGGGRQRVEVDWRDSRYALSARASLGAQAVEVERVQLSSGAASLTAQGKLALDGDGRFTAQGRLNHFDPARFVASAAAAIPRSLINASFEAHGALRPALALGLRFDLGDSRLGAHPLSGKGDVDLIGSRLRKLDVDLAAAGNRLHAAGAFGLPGDVLRLELLAPKLGALGWPALSGDARATVSVAGSLASPEFSGELQAVRLSLASLFEVDDLSLTAQLAAGAQGALSAALHCAACALPAYGVAPLTLDVKADGRRDRHHVSARVGLPGQRELRAALDGGWTPASGSASIGKARGKADGGAAWRGTLSELRVNPRAASAAAANPEKSPALLELAAPAALQVGASTLSFGPATINGLIGSLTIDRLDHSADNWQSSGRLQRFRPQDLLIEFPALAAWRETLGVVNPQPLVLAGEWDVALGARPTGRAALWRERGDLLLGALPLGLAEARVQASVADGRLTANALLRGQRLGEISAELTALGGRATGSAGARPALLDAQAPWQGRLQARVPDLAWLGPLLGEGWQLAGQLQGEMRLAGSAAHPQWSGEWRGDDLALRALDQGMRLERGQALLEITPERLLLRRLSFESDLQPLPRTLRLDERVAAARLNATPGRLEASGELALAGAASGTARLGLHLDRVGIVQRPEQWVAISGDGDIRLGERKLDVGGKLRVDAGFWALAAAGRPSLSDDVVRRGAQPAGGGSRVERALKLDLEVALGRSVYFRGAGVESRLAGDLRIRSDDAGLPRATGSIRTVDGRFDAYGQKLEIERGIVNFQGPIDNPGLNLLAVRKNLSVEAGVEVTGTASRPVIRLVSTPSVPDAEKLSWLVLGRSPEQSGGDSSLLLAAAQTIFGGQDGGVLSQLQRGLGIDEFGVSSGQVGGSASLPTSRVASSTGFGSSQTVNGQIVSVGKRLSSNAVLSYEQSLSTTESIVKLTVNLSRQFSVVGRAGSDSALDFFWNYSFGR